MAPSDFLDDVPSSPLSSVPSDFDRSSKSPGPQASLATNTKLNSKRKAPTTPSAPGRASRRLRTEDSFERSLTAIKEDIILPKVVESRQVARKQNVAARTENKRAPPQVKSQDAGEDEMHEDVKADADSQLAERNGLEAVTASLSSPQDLKDEAPPLSALIEAAGRNDATDQPPSTSVHEAKEESLPTQQPAAPTVHEAAEEPLETQLTPSPSRDDISEQAVDAQHSGQLEIEPKQDTTIHKEAINNDLPLPTTTSTPNTFSSPTITTPPVLANQSPTETPAVEQAEKLPPPEIPAETLDELTQEEPPTNGRPSRKRVQPNKLEDYEPPVKALSVPAKKKAQPIRGNWSVGYLLTNPKSKLATCNLNALLSHENAWTLLSRDQQLKLIAMLPPFIQENFPDFPDDMPIPNVMRQVMQSNNSFQADIRLFQEDLAAGRYEPKWLEDAQEAMEKRAQGHFDDWKERNREEFWGQKQKVDWTTNSGESAQYTLVDLVKAGLFEVGDIWCLKVGGQGVKVEKEAKICVIAADGALSFTYPLGEHKYSSPANGEDILLESVRNPKALTDAMLNEDGRLAGVRRGNAWRDYRCFRKAQDIGSPWDMRELYNVRQSS